MPERKRARCVVIGLDGATWDVLSPALDQGWMPALARLRSESACGALRSTRPPLTAPAWSSFMTGLNPGRHGVFSFEQPLEASLERRFVNGSYIHGEPFWDRLAAHGVTAGVLNVPMTWPVRPVHGWLVSGMMTPSESVEFTWPSHLAAGLRAAGYVIDLRVLKRERPHRKPAELLGVVRDLKEALLRRQKALEGLLEQSPVDLLTVVYETPDRLQHWAWGAIADLLHGAPFERTAIHDECLAAFGALDRCIAATLERAEPSAGVLVVSDHGFGARRSLFHANTWLEQQGLLRFRSGGAGMRRRMRPLVAAVKRALPAGLLRGGRRAFAVNRIIDWSRTLAYSGSVSEYCIRLNLRGREPCGIVHEADYAAVRDRVRQALASVPFPGDARARVFVREEVYSGPFVEQAPDIVFELPAGFESTPEIGRRGVFTDVSAENQGMHRPEGIIMARAAGIAAGRSAGSASIEDVAPTLFHLLGLPVPAGLDGRVIEWAVPASSGPVTYSAPSQPAGARRGASAGPTAFSADEESLVAGRLSDLGYIE